MTKRQFEEVLRSVMYYAFGKMIHMNKAKVKRKKEKRRNLGVRSQEL